MRCERYRKWILFLVVYLSAIMLFACGARDESKNTEEPAKETYAPPQEDETVMFHGKIVSKGDNRGILIVNWDDKESGELYSISIGGNNSLDEKGKEMKVVELVPGMLVDIQYNGIVEESYLAHFTSKSLHVKETDEDYVGLYLDLMSKIYEDDKGLNNDIKMIAIDLTEVRNLTVAEKNAVSYLLQNKCKLEVYQKTYEELEEEGFIDKENLYFKDGILIKIKTNRIKKTSFEYDISKWRSGLGAVGQNGCKAKVKNHEWTFEEGAYWVS